MSARGGNVELGAGGKQATAERVPTMHQPSPAALCHAPGCGSSSSRSSSVSPSSSMADRSAALCGQRDAERAPPPLVAGGARRGAQALLAAAAPGRLRWWTFGGAVWMCWAPVTAAAARVEVPVLRGGTQLCQRAASRQNQRAVLNAGRSGRPKHLKCSTASRAWPLNTERAIDSQHDGLYKKVNLP